MRFICFLCVVLIGSQSPVFAQEREKQPTVSSSMRIIGYLPDYRAAEFVAATAQPLTDLIVFSAQPTADGGIDPERLAKRIPWAELLELKTRARVRLILCVGGWERCAHFSSIAASAEKRQKFVKSAVQLCLDQRLDGLDLDWEHPKTETEQSNYGRLLKDLRAGFRSHGLVLSVTIAGWQNLDKEAIAAVDWINLMAYDHPGRHSTIEAVQAEVERFLKAGVPPTKLNLGLPFYGRNITKPEQTLTYRQIVEKYHPAPATDEVDGFYFNGQETIRRKTEWAMTRQLGGIMIWELGQDAAGDQALLNVVRSTVSKPR